MSAGLLESLLNPQSQTPTPAGQKMQVVMVRHDLILRNPENKIYIIGDVSQLKEDIRLNGVRQPLEVIRLENGGYKLIGGERRLTACKQLLDEGDKRFASLPCIIRDSQGELDDKIALITANATARELTDGERVAQYEALKDALTRKKKEGHLEGKVRDELCRILGLSAGAAARLNVIATCENDHIKHQLMVGEIGLMQAYQAAQDYARYLEQKNGKNEPEKPRKTATPETLPKEPEPAASTSTKKPDIPARDLEILERAAKNASPYAQPAPSAANPAAEPEKARGYDTLHKLAEKMLKETAPWKPYKSEAILGVSYYRQDLPGGAGLYKRVDETRKRAGQPCEDYAIILQSYSFFTCGWIDFHSGITGILTKYFELK